MAFNASNLNRISPYNLPGPVLFQYLTTDTIATVSSSTYFTPFAHAVNQSLLTSPFSVGDTISCNCSDGLIDITVSSINPITTAVETVTVIIGPNSVDTAAIQNSAVTSAKIADGAIVNADINASAAIAYSKLAALTSAHILVGSAGNVATDVAVTGDVTISNAGVTAIGAAKVTKAMLAATVRPSHMIVFSGSPTTVGGAAAEAFTVTGAVGATDKAYVQIVDNGTANVTALQAVVTDNTLTVTFSADPGNDTIFNYQIIRATS